MESRCLKKLVLAGVDVFRLNMSHGTHQEKDSQIENIRKIARKLGKAVAIIADLQGPKLRLGEINGEKKIEKGEVVKLSLNPVSDELPIQFDLTPYTKKGQRIYLNDGLVELKVVEIRGKTITTKALNTGMVSTHKGVNVPDTNLKGDSFTQKDFEDAQFALKKEVDFLALSFVQSVNDLKKVKELTKKTHPQTKVIVKIEKNEAVTNLDSIIQSADAVMVARGDLSVEAGAAQVPIIQEKIINLARQYQKPVIVATQMLESMVENPRATRAEISDIANAVLDQVDCVMLSAETASGDYPIEAVITMKQVIDTIEQHPQFQDYIKINWENIPQELLSINAVVSAAASITYRVGAKIIACATTSGQTARLLSSFRPSAQIIALTHDEKVQKQLSLVWGVKSLTVETANSSENFWKKISDTLKKSGMVKKGDKFVIISGSIVGVTGTTDIIRVISI